VSAPRDLNDSLRRYFVDRYQAREVALWPPDLRVLDIGGHKVAKRGQFDLSAFPVRVTCLNISSVKRPDVLGDGAALPFPDRVFDAVVCAELLEHVYDPQRVLAEVARVLRPGGRLLITVPFLVQIHGDPDDFGRYTDSFWRRALADQGFDAIAIEPHGQFWSVQLDAWRAWFSDIRQRGARRRWWFPVATRLLVWARRRAIRHESEPVISSTSRTSGLRYFTTGFGITGRKRVS